MSDTFTTDTSSHSGSSVHGISQARILEWVAISFSRGSPNPGIKPLSPALAGRFFTAEPQGKPHYEQSDAYVFLSNVFTFWGEMLRSRIAWSCFIFNFLKNLHTVFHSCCTVPIYILTSSITDYLSSSCYLVNSFFFLTKNMMLAVCLSYVAFIILRYVHFISTLLGVLRQMNV